MKKYKFTCISIIVFFVVYYALYFNHKDKNEDFKHQPKVVISKDTALNLEGFLIEGKSDNPFKIL